MRRFIHECSTILEVNRFTSLSKFSICSSINLTRFVFLQAVMKSAIYAAIWKYSSPYPRYSIFQNHKFFLFLSFRKIISCSHGNNCCVVNCESGHAQTNAGRTFSPPLNVGRYSRVGRVKRGWWVDDGIVKWFRVSHMMREEFRGLRLIYWKNNLNRHLMNSIRQEQSHFNFNKKLKTSNLNINFIFNLHCSTAEKVTNEITTKKCAIRRV